METQTTQNPEDLLARQRTLLSFEDVRERVAKDHERKLSDVTLDMADIKVVPHDRSKYDGVVLEVPKMGELTVTKWAERQLGSALGVNWEKWFDPRFVSPEDMEDELIRRFKGRNIRFKVRGSSYGQDSGVDDFDGYIRGFVSPKFASIDDERIFDRLQRNFGGFTADMRFMQDHLGGDFLDDRSSHYSVVSEMVKLGELTEENNYLYNAAQAEGQLPDGDYMWYGWHLRNSEVGFSALSICSFTYRLLCLNGAIQMTDGGKVLYRIHREISDPDIDKLLRDAFRKLGGVWRNNMNHVQALKDVAVEKPDAELRDFLGSVKAPQKFVDDAIAAFQEEPHKTRFGVMNAIARAAQNTIGDMNKRYDLEGLAGQYTMQAA